MSSAFQSIYRYVAMLLSIFLIISLVEPNFVEAAPWEAKSAPNKKTVTADIGELPNKLPKEKLELTNKHTSYQHDT